MKAALIFAALIACGAAEAQTYIGGSVGYGENGLNDEQRYASPTLQIDQQTRGESATLFAGHRFGMFGIEGGLMRLPRYKAVMTTSDYTAYLGVDVGIRTAYATDSVRAKSAYLRANVYAGDAYAFAGVARTTADQFTYGLYDSSTVGTARYHTTRSHSLYGIGWQRGGVRVEYLALPGAIENRAIGRRDVRMVQVGYSWSWK